MWFGKQTQIKLQQSAAKKGGTEVNSESHRNGAEEKMDLCQHLDLQRMRVHEQNPEKNWRQLQTEEGKIASGFLEVL